MNEINSIKNIKYNISNIDYLKIKNLVLDNAKHNSHYTYDQLYINLDNIASLEKPNGLNIDELTYLYEVLPNTDLSEQLNKSEQYNTNNWTKKINYLDFDSETSKTFFKIPPLHHLFQYSAPILASGTALGIVGSMTGGIGIAAAVGLGVGVLGLLSDLKYSITDKIVSRTTIVATDQKVSINDEKNEQLKDIISARFDQSHKYNVIKVANQQTTHENKILGYDVAKKFISTSPEMQKMINDDEEWVRKLSSISNTKEKLKESRENLLKSNDFLRKKAEIKGAKWNVQIKKNSIH